MYTSSKKHHVFHKHIRIMYNAMLNGKGNRSLFKNLNLNLVGSLSHIPVISNQKKNKTIRLKRTVEY